jgi:putative ABC transport system permease protein
VFGYYMHLGVRSLRRNIVLTLFMIVTMGIGIGAAMTEMAVMTAISRDPIPDKSTQLYTPRIDVWTAQNPDEYKAHPFVGAVPHLLTYRDAVALMREHGGSRESAMYGVRMGVSPAAARPYSARGQVVSTDFFRMFEVPFSAGGAWRDVDDTGATDVAVITDQMAHRLFPRGNAVGQSLYLDSHQYRVVGVLAEWNPTPRFYDLDNVGGSVFGQGEQFFIPFSTAMARQIPTNGRPICVSNTTSVPGWESLLNSECAWIRFWTELSTAATTKRYIQFLDVYASEQRRTGRFKSTPLVDLMNVKQALAEANLVSDEIRLGAWVGVGFLGLCLINVVGLMLAKFYGRAAEISVRRALGGAKSDIFFQCLAETVVLGAAGGLLGLALTAVGLAAQRKLLGTDMDRLASFDGHVVVSTLAITLVATVCAGLFPTWRMSRLQPGWLLKAP